MQPPCEATRIASVNFGVARLSPEATTQKRELIARSTYSSYGSRDGVKPGGCSAGFTKVTWSDTFEWLRNER